MLLWSNATIYFRMLITSTCTDSSDQDSWAMSRWYVTANGSGSVNCGAGVSVSVLNTGLTGLIPGNSVSVRPMGLATMSTRINHLDSRLLRSWQTKVFLKPVSKSGGEKTSSFKTFMLRNISTRNISTRSQLRALIKNQINTQGSIDIGYLQNNIVRNEDLAEIWVYLRKGTSKMWCDRLK